MPAFNSQLMKTHPFNPIKFIIKLLNHLILVRGCRIFIIKLMLANYNYVVSLIEKIATEEVKEAEKELQTLAKKDDIQLLACLHNIIKDTNQQINSKNSAALYINTVIADNVADLQLQQLIKYLTNILEDVAVGPSFKRMLERAIVTIIDKLQQPYLTEFREFTLTLAKNDLLRDTGCLLLACFATAQVDQVHTLYLTRLLFTLTLNRILTDGAEAFANAREYNQIIKTWIVVANRLIKLLQPEQKMEKGEKQLLKIEHAQTVKVLFEMSESQGLCSVLLALYKWVACPELFLTVNKDLCELNILKGQAAQLQCILTKFSTRNNYQTAIYKFGLNNLNDFVKNIVIVATNRKAIDEYMCQDFITNLVSIIKVIFIASPSIFGNIWKSILSNMVFPLICADNDELQYFEQNPQHFLSLFEDCCQKQKFGILKTEVISLLQVMGDKSQLMDPQQSCIDFIFAYCIDSIKSCLKLNVQRQWNMNFLSLETSFLIITVFSFRIQYHKQILVALNTILKIPNMRQHLPPFQCSRIYLCLAYNYAEVFKDPNEGLMWINSAIEQNNHPTVVLCGLDFLSNVANEYYSDYFFEAVSDKVVSNTFGQFWDLLQKLIKDHNDKIHEESMIKLVNKCFEKLEIQLKETKSQEVIQTINIVKILNIFKLILGLTEYIQTKPTLQENIWKVTTGFNDFVVLNLDDDVLEIISLFLKNQQNISQFFTNILPMVLTKFGEGNYAQKQYHIVLNQFIMKSTGPHIEAILKALKTGLIFHVFDMEGQNKKNKHKQSIGNLLILTQNLLNVHHASLQPNDFYEISSIAYRFIPEESINDDKIIVARALNTIFLCSMFLEKQEEVENSLSIISKYMKEKVFFGYDVRVLFLCFQHQIFKQTDKSNIVEMLRILATVIKIYKDRKEQEKVVKNIRNKNSKTKLNHIKMQRNYFYEQILKVIETPFKEIKVEEEIKDMLETMKTKNNQFYLTVINELDDQSTNILAKFKTGNERVKMKIIGIKARDQVEDDIEKLIEQNKAEGKKNKDQMDSDDEEESDDEDLGFKRKRVIEKKKKKNNKDKMTEEK